MSLKHMPLIAVVSILFSTSAYARDLFVATNGSDSVSYSANSISNPWRTIKHGAYSAQSGDVVNVRAGNYSEGGIITKNNVSGGSPGSPTTITGYQNERPVVDVGSFNTFLDVQGINHIALENMTFINALHVIKGGEDSGADYIAMRGTHITMNRGGDNAAAFKCTSGCDYVEIEGNTIIGPGSGAHGNSGALHFRKFKNIKVLNNHISNAPICMYFKHAPPSMTASNMNVEVAYNIIHNCSRNSSQFNFSYANIHDNIFHNTASFLFSEGNGFSGGDYNVLSNNTFYNTRLDLPNDSSGNDQFQGSYGNTFTNNVIWNTTRIHRYESQPHNTTMDYNVYNTSPIVENNGRTYSLSAWRSANGGDSNSVQGTVRFVSSNPTQPADFALAANSAGKGIGPGGKDPGANVALVGPAGSGEIPPPPMPPTALNVLVQ